MGKDPEQLLWWDKHLLPLATSHNIDKTRRQYQTDHACNQTRKGIALTSKRERQEARRKRFSNIGTRTSLQLSLSENIKKCSCHIIKWRKLEGHQPGAQMVREMLGLTGSMAQKPMGLPIKGSTIWQHQKLIKI